MYWPLGRHRPITAACAWHFWAIWRHEAGVLIQTYADGFGIVRALTRVALEMVIMVGCPTEVFAENSRFC